MEDRTSRGLKVKFLLNLCNLPSEEVPEKLKSNFGIICQNTGSMASLPVKFTSKQKVCQYCMSHWSDTNCRVKITPRIKPGAAMGRILRKVAKHKKLSQVEKKLAMRAHSGNKIEITCLLCMKKTSILVNKPEKVKEPPSLLETEVQEMGVKKKKKKKTPILNIPTAPPSSAVISQEETIDLCDDDIIVLDSCGSLPDMTPPSKKPTFAEEFIPLEASTPFVKRKRQKKLYLNPLAVSPMTKKSCDPSASTSKEKRISSLKKLLAQESPKFPRSGNSLKSFLSSL